MPPQVHHARQRRVMVFQQPVLHEPHAPAEMIHYRLIPLRRPPLDGEIKFPARHDDPVGRSVTCQPVDQRLLRYLLFAQMDVPLERLWRDAQAEPLAEVLAEPVQEMDRLFVAAVNQRVMAVQPLHSGILVIQRRDVGIVAPQIRAGSAHIGDAFPWVAPVQVAHGGSQHQDVAGGLVVLEEKLLDGHVPGFSLKAS